LAGPDFARCESDSAAAIDTIVTNHPNLALARSRSWRSWVSALVVLAACLLSQAGWAQSLIINNYYWYVPEHEKYAPTVFYGDPRFDSRPVRVRATQRFKLLGIRRGWLLIEFDIAGKVYIHTRLVQSMMYSPASSDLLAEFKRASVFEEEPAKIEARLQAVRANPQADGTDSKIPAWKRYKDSWGLKPGRSPPPSTAGETADAASTPLPSRPQEKKPRSKYPLLPPIGSEPKQDTPEPEAPPAGDGTNVPAPRFP